LIPKVFDLIFDFIFTCTFRTIGHCFDFFDEGNRMKVHERAAYCGLLCEGCPIRWATLEEDAGQRAKMREAVVLLTRELYGMEIKPEDVTDCEGCRTETGNLFSSCLQCEIRKCARQKAVGSCALCGEYPCGNLTQFFEKDPDAKSRLEFVRRLG
jgi:hypothetical protein